YLPCPSLTDSLRMRIRPNFVFAGTDSKYSFWLPMPQLIAAPSSSSAGKLLSPPGDLLASHIPDRALAMPGLRYSNQAHRHFSWLALDAYAPRLNRHTKTANCL